MKQEEEPSFRSGLRPVRTFIPKDLFCYPIVITVHLKVAAVGKSSKRVKSLGDVKSMYTHACLCLEIEENETSVTVCAF